MNNGMNNNRKRKSYYRQALTQEKSLENLRERFSGALMEAGLQENQTMLKKLESIFFDNDGYQTIPVRDAPYKVGEVRDKSNVLMAEVTRHTNGFQNIVKTGNDSLIFSKDSGSSQGDDEFYRMRFVYNNDKKTKFATGVPKTYSKLIEPILVTNKESLSLHNKPANSHTSNPKLGESVSGGYASREKRARSESQHQTNSRSGQESEEYGSNSGYYRNPYKMSLTSQDVMGNMPGVNRLNRQSSCRW